MAPFARLFFSLVVLSLVTASPVVAATYFGLVDTGELYASADGGNTWSLRGALPVPDAIALVAGTSPTELMMASESGTFYRSSDAGAHWIAVSVVPASDVTALVCYPGRVLLFTRTGAVYSSLDSGTTFTSVGIIIASDVVSVTRLNTSVYAVTRTGDVYRSTNNGATWIPLGVIPASDCVEIVPLDNRLYVLTSTGDIARSSGGGASWTFVGALSQSGMTALALATDILIATTEAGEVATSTNGIAWTWRGTMNQLKVRALATDIPTGTDVPMVPDVAFGFLGPRPNPGPLAHASTLDLAFNLRESMAVSVHAFDVHGREVAIPMDDEVLPAGETLRAWQPGALAGGTYFLRATIGDHVETRKFLYPGTP